MQSPERTLAAWSLSDVLDATGGQLVGANEDCRRDPIVFSDVSIDTRTLSAGALYLAIRGKRLDGHAFVESAWEAGAAGVMIMPGGIDEQSVTSLIDQGVRVIEVPNTTEALGAMGRFRRQNTGVRLVAVTGSAGKTSTREMIRCVLASRYETHVPDGNFNNEIGLPLTLLKLKSSHVWCVAELGMNAPGEIETLTRICDPDIGVITNVGPAHVEGLGSVEGVAAAKGELAETIRAGGHLVLNRDDFRVARMEAMANAPVLWFGHADDADIRAENVRSTEDGLTFDLVTPEGTQPNVHLNTGAGFMVVNALAAAGIGYLAGMTPQDIGKALSTFYPVAGRQETISGPMGSTIINDAYNANPVSMQGAIDTLSDDEKADCRIAVLGDMKELGALAESCHRDIGAYCASRRIDRLYITGDYADQVAAGALAAGMDESDVVVAEKEVVARDLISHLSVGTTVLVKGSRSMAMETVIRDLMQIAEAGDENIPAAARVADEVERA